MDIAPVQKGVYTLGKRTAIPGMGKFDPLSQMKVWNETVRTETDAWSRGLKENPPSKEFRVVRPDKMLFAEGKPAFSQRAVDVQAERAARRRAQSAEPGAREMGSMSLEEKQEFMDTLRQTSRTPLEKMSHDSYTAHWRGATLGKGDMRQGRGVTRAGMVPSTGVDIRCKTPLLASHDIGWNTEPLITPGNYTLRLRERCRRKSCKETLFADSYFATTRCPFTSKFAGTGR